MRRASADEGFKGPATWCSCRVGCDDFFWGGGKEGTRKGERAQKVSRRIMGIFSTKKDVVEKIKFVQKQRALGYTTPFYFP